MAVTITTTVKSNIQWRATQMIGSQRWLGICDVLNLTMEAASLDELHGVIEEAIQLLMRDLLEDGELDTFLRQHGWQATGLPAVPSTDHVEFNVPWELVAPRAEHDRARIAH